MYTIVLLRELQFRIRKKAKHCSSFVQEESDKRFAANSLSLLFQLYMQVCMILTPLLRGMGEDFVAIRKETFFFLIFHFNIGTIVCCAVLCLIFSIDKLVSLTQNCVIYTKLTIPKKQQTNVGLQKGKANAAEAICCPISKGR